MLILCDDDFYPCKNFLAELNTTIRLLPEKTKMLNNNDYIYM